MGFGFPLGNKIFDWVFQTFAYEFAAELENEAITIGVIMAAQYFLPSNISDYNPTYFPGIVPNFTPTNFNVIRPFGRFKRETKTDELTGQTFESYEGDVKEVGNEALRNVTEKGFYEDSFDDEFIDDGKNPKKHSFVQGTKEQLTDTSGTRWLLYDGIGRLLNSKGMVGRPCVLRAICDAAQSRFNQNTGLFGELLHIAFT